MLIKKEPQKPRITLMKQNEIFKAGAMQPISELHQPLNKRIFRHYR